MGEGENYVFTDSSCIMHVMFTGTWPATLRVHKLTADHRLLCEQTARRLRRCQRSGAHVKAESVATCWRRRQSLATPARQVSRNTSPSPTPAVSHHLFVILFAAIVYMVSVGVCFECLSA